MWRDGNGMGLGSALGSSSMWDLHSSLRFLIFASEREGSNGEIPGGASALGDISGVWRHRHLQHCLLERGRKGVAERRVYHVLGARPPCADWL